MGRVAVSLDIERIEGDDNYTLAKVDLGGNNVISPELYTSPGIDSAPMDGDYVATSSAPGNSGQSAVGTIDPVNGGVAGKGEIRVYARDEDGNTIVAIYLKKNGEILIGGDSDNMVRFSSMKTGFDTLKQECQSNFTAIAAAITTVAGLLVPPVTAPPYVPVPLTATVDAAKIDEIKVP